MVSISLSPAFSADPRFPVLSAEAAPVAPQDALSPRDDRRAAAAAAPASVGGGDNPPHNEGAHKTLPAAPASSARKPPARSRRWIEREGISFVRNLAKGKEMVEAENILRAYLTASSEDQKTALAADFFSRCDSLKKPNKLARSSLYGDFAASILASHDRVSLGRLIHKHSADRKKNKEVFKKARPPFQIHHNCISQLDRQLTYFYCPSYPDPLLYSITALHSHFDPATSDHHFPVSTTYSKEWTFTGSISARWDDDYKQWKFEPHGPTSATGPQTLQAEFSTSYRELMRTQHALTCTYPTKMVLTRAEGADSIDLKMPNGDHFFGSAELTFSHLRGLSFRALHGVLKRCDGSTGKGNVLLDNNRLVMTGKGSWTSPNGTLFSGQFNRGRLDGFVQVKDANEAMRPYTIFCHLGRTVSQGPEGLLSPPSLELQALRDELQVLRSEVSKLREAQGRTQRDGAGTEAAPPPGGHAAALLSS